MSDKSKPPDLKMKVQGDGFMFELRDGAFMLVQWNSPKQLQVTMWQGTEFVAPDIGNIFSSAFRSKLVEAARARFRDENGNDLAPNIAADIDRVAVALGAPQPGGKTLHDQLEETAGSSVTDRLILYARKNARFFHDPEREGFASAKVNGHIENYRIRSRSFRLWVRHMFWEEEKRRAEEEALESEGALSEGPPQIALPPVLRDQALSDAIHQLETLAIFEGPEEVVHLRTAGSVANGRIYVDLCDQAWRVVEITPEGWQVIPGEESPVKFIRKSGMLSLPEPVEEEGSLEKLRDLLNLGDRGTHDGERNWRLVGAWLVQALVPRGPYPVLTLLGNQGSAKSTTQRLLRNLIDPNTAPIRTKPREEHHLYIDAGSAWVIALDNMSSMPEWLSDALCRLATGGGFSTRRLYTDEEQILFDAQRPVSLNGIGDVITRPDLLDRALIVQLPDVKDEARREEGEIYSELEEAQAGVLGALLTAVSAYLANVGEVKLPGLPRMADFAKLGVATERALGSEEGSFLTAYAESREQAVETALEAWPIVAPLWEFARSFDEEAPWTGTATELFNALNSRAEDEVKRSKDWPKQPNVLSGQLNRLTPSLAKVGVHLVRHNEHGGQRKIQVFWTGKV